MFNEQDVILLGRIPANRLASLSDDRMLFVRADGDTLSAPAGSGIWMGANDAGYYCYGTVAEVRAALAVATEPQGGVQVRYIGDPMQRLQDGWSVTTLDTVPTWVHDDGRRTNEPPAEAYRRPSTEPQGDR